jgi:hypothetical protein
MHQICRSSFEWEAVQTLLSHIWGLYLDFITLSSPSVKLWGIVLVQSDMDRSGGIAALGHMRFTSWL